MHENDASAFRVEETRGVATCATQAAVPPPSWPLTPVRDAGLSHRHLRPGMQRHAGSAVKAAIGFVRLTIVHVNVASRPSRPFELLCACCD